MATSDNNYSGYSTYILGTTKNILRCLGILVYNKSQLPPGTDKISLYNIDQVYKKVLQSEKYVRIERKDSYSTFDYISGNGVINGFDTIIYLNNSDNSPTGYTEFLNKQGEGRNVSISLAFNSVISGDLTIDLSNSLTQLKNNSTVNKNFTGKDLFHYPSVYDIKEDVDNCLWNSPDYTTNLSSVIKSPNIKNIFLTYGVLRGDSDLIKLDLSKDIIVDPYEFGFTNYQFGYYSGDIVVYLWKDLNYTIYSLTKRNRFENPISYIKSNNGYLTIPETEGKKSKITLFSGKYIVLEVSSTSENSTELFNFETQERSSVDYRFITDPFDPNNRLIKLPNILNYSNIFDYLPEISNIHLDLYEYSKINSIDITRKLRNWYTIRRPKEGINIYSGISITVYFSSEEIPIIINDQTIMIFTSASESEGNDLIEYYTVYKGNFKTFYSEKARVLLEKGKLSFNKDINVFICTGGSRDEEYIEYYKSGDIRIINTKDKFNKSYFSKFRRNILPNHTDTIPDIIGAVDGIIFYKNQNYINYI